MHQFLAKRPQDITRDRRSASLVGTTREPVDKHKEVGNQNSNSSDKLTEKKRSSTTVDSADAKPEKTKMKEEKKDKVQRADSGEKVRYDVAI